MMKCECCGCSTVWRDLVTSNQWESDPAGLRAWLKDGATLHPRYLWVCEECRDVLSYSGEYGGVS